MPLFDSITQAGGEFDGMVRLLLSTGRGSPSAEDQVALAAQIRALPDAGPRLDRELLTEIGKLRNGLSRAKAQQAALKKVHDALTAPPWFPAVFLGCTLNGRGTTALIAQGESRRVVSMVESIDPSALQAGDEVLLSQEQNVIVDVMPQSYLTTGETATFDRFTPDGRLVVRARDEDVVTRAGGQLDTTALRSGDSIRWHRELGLVVERLDRSSGQQYFLEDTPAETFDAVGGLAEQVRLIQRAIQLHFDHPEIAAKYQLRPTRAVLLVGPPGGGKTLIAKATANWVATRSASGRSRFINVKPGGLHSMWYGQSEANYREAFRAARAASEQDPGAPVVMFFDEIDAVGAARGGHMRVDNRVLTALMAELDGLETRGNVLVMAATNRRDAIDPALLRPGRLGDLVLEIPRPGRTAAAAIFAKHLPANLPYGAGDAARQELIDAAVSRIYAPNGIGPLATITLRDGVRRPVAAADLASGAIIAQICASAAERAGVRELETGAEGLQLADLLDTVDAELETAARVLTPANCRLHLASLPQDVDVVRVEATTRRIKREHRWLRIA